MTVAVACNLAEGVILGVDSAVTMNDVQGNVLKVYENATKLFQLGDKPVGIAMYGLGAIGNRNIGSYIREFEKLDPQHVVSQEANVEDIVEELRKFFLEQYNNVIVPALETQTQKRFDEIPNEAKPLLGLAVGGFSKEEYLSEIWEILIPIHITLKSALRWCDKGEFRSVWFALNEPIFRYVKGYDRNLLSEIKNYFAQLRGAPLNKTETEMIEKILLKHEYQFPIAGMPIMEGIAYVKFLVEMVINHHRFSIGAPVVGGKAKIGLVTYKGEKFRILSESEVLPIF